MIKKAIHYLGPNSPWGTGISAIACSLVMVAAAVLALPWLWLFLDWYYPFVRSLGK